MEVPSPTSSGRLQVQSRALGTRGRSLGPRNVRMRGVQARTMPNFAKASVSVHASTAPQLSMGGIIWGGYQATFTPQMYVSFWRFGGGCQCDPAGAPPPAPPRGPRHAPMTASHAKFQRQRCSGRAATVGGSIRRSTPRGPLSANMSLIEAQGLRTGFGGTLL